MPGAAPPVSIRQIDRHVKLRGQPHLAHRFSIALGMGPAVVAQVAFLERFAFLMTDDHHLVGVELGPARPDRPIVAKTLVPVQLDELVEEQFQVILRHGAIRVARHLDRFPRRQVRVDLLRLLHQFPAERADLAANLRRRLGLAVELLQPGFQLVDRSLEREPVVASCHGILYRSNPCRNQSLKFSVFST